MDSDSEQTIETIDINEYKLYLEDEMDRFNIMIDNMWEIIQKHIEKGAILGRLGMNDKHKFYEYMYKTSAPIKKICELYNTN